MKKVEMRREGLSTWVVRYSVDGQTKLVEKYGNYASARNRVDYFKRMDWRLAVVIHR